MNLTRLFPVFSVVFVLCYALCVYFNLALFTYMPAQGRFYFLVPEAAHARGTYPMFWYGWLTTCLIAALVLTAIIAVLPIPQQRGGWSALVWISPLVAVAVVVYALRIWFTL